MKLLIFLSGAACGELALLFVLALFIGGGGDDDE